MHVTIGADGGAENAGRENDGREIDGPNDRSADFAGPAGKCGASVHAIEPGQNAKASFCPGIIMPGYNFSTALVSETFSQLKIHQNAFASGLCPGPC